MKNLREFRSPNANKSISRRNFLIYAGAAGISVSITPVFTSNLLSNWTSMNPSSDVSKDLAQVLLDRVKNSPMYIDINDQLQKMDFDVELNAQRIRLSSQNNGFVGLILPHSRTVDQRTGVDLSLTFDHSNEELAIAQICTGRSLPDMVYLWSIEYDARLPLYTESRNPRVNYEQPPSLIRPRKECSWSFPRPEPIPMRVEDLPEYGWPVENTGSNLWHYYGSLQADWFLKNGIPTYRIVQIQEKRGKAGKGLSDASSGDPQIQDQPSGAQPQAAVNNSTDSVEETRTLGLNYVD